MMEKQNLTILLEDPKFDGEAIIDNFIRIP